jgi:ABC-type transport system involved in multi-copper enzyme maturation permease subunit
MGIWGLMAVLYMGSGILKGEFQRKTVYLILSRPVGRATFLLGKYAGMLMVLGTIFFVLSAFWLFLLVSKSVPLGATQAFALLFILGEWILLAALSLFFASFTSPILHNFFLIGITFLGHWSNDLRLFSENAKNIFLKNLLKFIYTVLPNLEALNFREEAIYNTAIKPELVGDALMVLFLWTVAVLAAANLIFLKRKIL